MSIRVDEPRDVPVVDPKSHTRTIDTQLIAAMAAWLIFNSHLETYYPRRYLAADGLLGNSLFFLLSGYGVQMSLLGRSQSFVEYAWRRIIRLYPAIIIAVALFELLEDGHWRDYGVANYLQRFIYPTQFTYVQNIVPFYVALYFIGRLRSARGWYVGSAVGIAAYLAGCVIVSISTGDGRWLAHLNSNHVLSRWAHYWVVLCLGALAAVRNVRSECSVSRVAVVGLTLAAYFAIRGYIIITGTWLQLALVVDTLVTVACVCFLLTFGDPRFVERIRRLPVVGFFIAVSGACTLEIFVLHQPMAERFYFNTLRFPFDILALAAACFVFSWILHGVCEAIRVRLEPRRRRA